MNWTLASNDGGATISQYTASASDGTNTFSCVGTGASATTCTITGLTNGTPYNVDLRATNSVGDSSLLHAGVATPLGVPNAPHLVSATGGATSIVVHWAAAASNGGSVVTSYTASATLLLVTKSCSGVGAAATTCTITGLTNGSSYAVSVLESNTFGSSPLSNTLLATPKDIPGAPSGVTVTTHTGSVTVAWTAPVVTGGDPITSYTVTSSPGTASCTTATTSCTVSALTPTTAYTFLVRANNSAGPGVTASSTVVYPFAPSTLTILLVTPILTKGVPFLVLLAGSAPHNVATVNLFNVAPQSCVFNAARQCGVTMTEPQNGSFRIVAKVGILPAVMFVWVPLVRSPATVRHGHVALVRVDDCPVGALVTFTVSDGRHLSAHASSLGVVLINIPMIHVGTVSITTSVSGTVLVPSSHVHVT